MEFKKNSILQFVKYEKKNFVISLKKLKHFFFQNKLVAF